MAKKAMINKEQKRAKLAAAGKYPTVRLHNRCSICGRPHGFHRDFGLCRICLRKMAHEGLLPGVTKASWQRERAEAGAFLFASDKVTEKHNAELPLIASEQDGALPLRPPHWVLYKFTMYLCEFKILKKTSIKRSFYMAQ